MWTLLAGSLLLVLTGCALAPRPEPSPVAPPEAWPVDPEAEMRPGDMVVEPARARPGEVVSVTYAAPWDRGILYAIEREGVGGWMRMALMISDANGGRPSWFLPGDRDVAVEAVGVAGTGPDRVPIPEIIEPGSYRICTANAGDKVCAPVEVIGEQSGG